MWELTNGWKFNQALAVRGSEEDNCKNKVGFSEEKDTDVKVSASDAYLAYDHSFKVTLFLIDMDIIFREK